MVAFSAFPTTSERAAGTSRDALVSRSDKHSSEMTSEYHNPPPAFNPA